MYLGEKFAPFRKTPEKRLLFETTVIGIREKIEIAEKSQENKKALAGGAGTCEGSEVRALLSRFYIIELRADMQASSRKIFSPPWFLRPVLYDKYGLIAQVDRRSVSVLFLSRYIENSSTYRRGNPPKSPTAKTSHA
jgi:hypothetical protein